MKVHIIGAGPTGMSIAWELKKYTDHDVVVYDKKTSAGGSWWEPSIDTRDLHAHRIVFDCAFINTNNLFKEMGIKWDDIFQKVESTSGPVISKYLSAMDYMTLTTLAVKVLAMPWKYKKVSLKDAIGPLSENGRKLMEAVTLVIDGVPWNVMTAYEFVKSFDHVGLSSAYTQKGSGKIMSDAMHGALVNRGVQFKFESELKDVVYRDDGFTGYFENGEIIEDGLLVLCLDNSPAIKFVKDNWGDDAVNRISPSTYGAINVILEYEEEISIASDLQYIIDTELHIQPVVLADKKTISCVICDLTPEVLRMDEDTLTSKVVEQLNIIKPVNVRIGWGADWNGTKWVFDQSSGVLNPKGHIPFFGKSETVAMCGMMSYRYTPYSSIEAAVEVGQRFCNHRFGTRKPSKPLMVTDVLLLFVVLLVAALNMKRFK
jgi:phytoene dehydrogenase-like protein